MYFTTNLREAPSGALFHFRQQLPPRIMASNRFESGAHPLPTEIAITKREIAPDPAGWITALRIDVDHADASTRWMDADLPQPSLVIVNPANGHAHYIWMLRSWIDHAKPKSLRWFTAIRHAYTAALGGDHAYAGRFMHNPFHADFTAIEGPIDYDLASLAECVDLDVPVVRVQSDKPGRNCAAFDAVRAVAYRLVNDYRATNSRTAFEAEILRAATHANGRFDVPLPASEVRTIARSISRWTWTHYTGNARKRVSREQYIGRKEQLRTAARRLRRNGAAIASIQAELKISRRTAYRYVRYVSMREPILCQVSLSELRRRRWKTEPNTLPPGQTTARGAQLKQIATRGAPKGAVFHATEAA